MRRAFLLRSARRRIPDENVLDAAYMWQRHALMLPFVVVAGFVVLALGLLFSFETVSAAGLGVLAAIVGGSSATRYFVLVKTVEGVVLCQGSRIRQVAVEIVERLPADSTIEPLDGTMLTTDWSVAGVRYTVSKSSEKAIEAMAAG